MLSVVSKRKLGWYLQKALRRLSQQRYSGLGCQNTVDNDVPGSWNMCYLYYLSGITLLGRIRGLGHA